MKKKFYLVLEMEQIYLLSINMVKCSNGSQILIINFNSLNHSNSKPLEEFLLGSYFKYLFTIKSRSSMAFTKTLVNPEKCLIIDKKSHTYNSSIKNYYFYVDLKMNQFNTK